ncbi:MAG TPA: ribosomal RNA small subunit methyltransferase A [Methanomicrobia archaeon]|nr:ribosomal RNA small subunit methyltransferase A [Methanomicrobia archaeon]
MNRDVIGILKARGLRPERRLGQYFLTDEGVATRMITYAAVMPNDIVLEIGAGAGSLTELLNRAAKRVYAVEKDQALAALLRERFETAASVTEILEGDVLELSLPKFDKVVASIPFMISARLTYKLLLHEAGFGLAVLLIQHEFAEKLVAAPRTEAYGRLSVVAQALTDVEVLETVPRGAFYPPAPVIGAVVRLQESAAKRDLIGDKAQFLEFVTAAFAQRRKKLKAVFKGLYGEEHARCADLEQRPEELTPEAFIRLALWLTSKP